jgi:hypothetical protein
MAFEQSSLEALKCPLVATLTPKMSDAAIRALSESAWQFAVSQLDRLTVSAVASGGKRTIDHEQKASGIPRPKPF